MIKVFSVRIFIKMVQRFKGMKQEASFVPCLFTKGKKLVVYKLEFTFEKSDQLWVGRTGPHFGSYRLHKMNAVPSLRYPFLFFEWFQPHGLTVWNLNFFRDSLITKKKFISLQFLSLRKVSFWLHLWHEEE